LREQLQALMERHGIDLWICPSALGAAPEGLDSTGDPALNLPWTHAGLPVLGLPVGRAANGLPLGLQCAAGWHCDEALLGWGRMLAEVLE
jgi:Asp-tRNA(Asn)/Glu-tRNA(Gln) amidotransferase A subunit family amidase